MSELSIQQQNHIEQIAATMEIEDIGHLFAGQLMIYMEQMNNEYKYCEFGTQVDFDMILKSD